jgi:hypothetical protein
MSRKRKTIDVVGVIRFGYRKKPGDLASVVKGCVRQWSMGDQYIAENVVLRDVKIVEAVCSKGVAAVTFKVRAYRDGRDAVSLGNAAVSGVWEACRSDFYEPDEPNEFGLHLLELEDTQLLRPAEDRGRLDHGPTMKLSTSRPAEGQLPRRRRPTGPQGAVVQRAATVRLRR